jgi:hypothetical protein
LRLAAAGQLHQRVPDLLPVHQHHGKDGPGLDRNLKHLGLAADKTHQRTRQDQVAGGGNRQELGQPFHNAHDGGLDQQ